MNGEWQPPAVIHEDNWQIAGCPVNGSAIAANVDDLAVAWFMVANGVGLIKLAFRMSTDDAFDTPVIIDNHDPVGRVDVRVAVSWLCVRQQFCIGTISTDCRRSPVYRLTRNANIVGFPKMRQTSDGLFMVWLESVADVTYIKTAKLNLDS